jgi:hypothetical protein
MGHGQSEVGRDREQPPVSGPPLQLAARRAQGQHSCRRGRAAWKITACLCRCLCVRMGARAGHRCACRASSPPSVFGAVSMSVCAVRASLARTLVWTVRPFRQVAFMADRVQGLQVLTAQRLLIAPQMLTLFFGRRRSYDHTKKIK